MANSVTFPVSLGGSGVTIDDSSNPGVGLGNGGHKTLFVPALSQTVVMAQTAVTNATNALSYQNTTSGYMTTTLGYQNAASASATLSQNWATQLVTPVSGGEYSAKYWAQQSAASAAASAMVTFTDATAVVKGTADNTKLLKFNVSGFTTATTRTVTIPDKSGTMAMLDDGGLVPVGEIILASPAANIDFLNVFTSAYDRYLITFDELRTSSGASPVCFRAAVAGVADATASSYTQTVWNTSISGPTSTNISVGNADAGVALGGSGSLTLYEVNSTTNTNKRISYEAMYGSTGSTSGVQGYGYYIRGAGAAAMSGFRLYLATGVNFAVGARVRVYGYKKA